MSPAVPRFSRPQLCAWLVFVFVWLGSFSGSSLAWAAATVMITVRTSDAADPTPYELRLRSELAAEGIDAIAVNALSAGGDAKQTAARFGANAVIDATVSVNEVSVLVWVSDPGLSLEVNRSLRMSNQQRDAVGVFALRTVDLLQGARLELEQSRRARQAAAAAASAPAGAEGNATPPSATPPQTQSEDRVGLSPARSTWLRTNRPRSSGTDAGSSARFRVRLAYTLMATSDEFGWATAPAVGLSFYPKPNWAIGVAFMGPYLNRIDVKSQTYRIEIDQEYLQFEVRRCVRLGSTSELEPYVGLGGSRYAATGEAVQPVHSYDATAWSMYAVLGASYAYRISERWRLVADLAGIGRVQSPHIQIRRGSDNLTGDSRWNLLLALGPGWVF